MMQHRRVVYPAPSGQNWHMGCSCGWKTSIDLATPGLPVKGEDIQALLDDRFVSHLAPSESGQYLKVDRRPGHEGQWIMPEGRWCMFSDWYIEDDTYFAKVVVPVQETMVIGEIITEQGQVFRME